MTIRNSSRSIARVFRATAAPGCRDELLQRFHSSSAALANGKVGCLKYRILEPVDAPAPEVVFESIWRDLGAVKVAFGERGSNHICQRVTPHLLRHTRFTIFSLARVRRPSN
jgi:quinol monooxygenase YgiN